jgi:UDP-glucose 4-epimerase
MRILVTGGAGHIGSHLVLYLGKLNYVKNIVIIDNMFTQRYSSFFNLPFSNKISVELSDVRELSIDSWIFKDKVDLVIHLAAMTDPIRSIEEPEKVFGNNFNATFNIANLCKTLEIPLIYPSTTSVYHPNKIKKVIFETESSLYGGNPYSKSKIAEEDLIKGIIGLRFVILRLGTVFGISPGMRFHTAVNKFCLEAALGKEITVWKTALNQVRPYLALRDFDLSISHIIKNSLYDSQIYNLVSTNTTVANIIKFIESNLNEKVTLKLIESKIMNDLSFDVSSSKFQKTSFTFTGVLNDEIYNTLNLFKGIKR